MTVTEAKLIYGDPLRGGYVSCTSCPEKGCGDCGGYMSGFQDCWEVIAEHANAKNDALSEIEPDNVNHPAHYETGKFECIDVMVETQGEEAVKAYCLCAAFKYLYRHNRKNGLEDIKKARWYLDKYIEMEGGSDDKT